MKLLYCKSCLDIFNLDYKLKRCSCGHSEGYYVDQVNAVYSGSGAVPLGITNTSLFDAIVNRPNDGMGLEFNAFVIPNVCDTFRQVSGLKASSEHRLCCKN
jgi:hypothetical protein